MSNAAFFVVAQTGVPPLALGEPGTCKTRTVESFAKFLGREYEVIVGSEREPGDIIGYPALETVDGKRVLEFVPSAWRHRLTHAKGGGLLHLDELTNSSPAVQAAFLRTLADGIPNTHIVATANPLASATVGFDLSPATVNRLCVLDWQNPDQEWKDGLLTGFQSKPSQFPRLPQNWEEGVAQTNSLVVAFLRAKPDLAQKLPSERSEAAKPWPSFRSWTNASRVYAASIAAGQGPEVLAQVVQGCIGEGAAIEFLTWVRALDLPDPEELLADPKLYKPSTRGDLNYAILLSVVSAVLRKNDLDRWNAAFAIIETQCEKAVDIACLPASQLVNNRPSGAKIPRTIRERLAPVLNAAVPDA